MGEKIEVGSRWVPIFNGGLKVTVTLVDNLKNVAFESEIGGKAKLFLPLFLEKYRPYLEVEPEIEVGSKWVGLHSGKVAEVTEILSNEIEVQYEDGRKVLNTEATFREKYRPLEEDDVISPAKDTAQKFDTDKTRYDLLPPEALEEIAKVLTYGAKKYEPHNWKTGIKYSRFFSACMRHLWAWMRGENNDPETGLSHLAHACCNIMFLLTYTVGNKTELDDRYKEVD